MKESASWNRRAFIKNIGYGLFASAISVSFSSTAKMYNMKDKRKYDIMIVGGSYAGLAAAMALGRALKKVLVIDDGMPCNRQTPFSHNFLTNDGKTPAQIRETAYEQVQAYTTIEFVKGRAVKGSQIDSGFEITVEDGQTFEAGKIIFATGIKDLLPPIEGMADCWGISVIHCPYCHGYEYSQEKTGILGNADKGFEFAQLISNWTNDLTLFTNGIASFSKEQEEKLKRHGITINEKKIERLAHSEGRISEIIFTDHSTSPVKALYAPSPFEQHCRIPMQMGCETTEEGYIKIDKSFETNIKGIYAIGDNASKMRTVANAVAMGTAAGIHVSKQMIAEEF